MLIAPFFLDRCQKICDRIARFEVQGTPCCQRCVITYGIVERNSSSSSSSSSSSTVEVEVGNPQVRSNATPKQEKLVKYGRYGNRRVSYSAAPPAEITLEDINMLKVDKLRAELERRSLSSEGRKSELRERLTRVLTPPAAVAMAERFSATATFAEWLDVSKKSLALLVGRNTATTTNAPVSAVPRRLQNNIAS